MPDASLDRTDLLCACAVQQWLPADSRFAAAAEAKQVSPITGDVGAPRESGVEMDATDSRVFAMAVNLPRSYMGRAELRVGPDSVTLVARPIRHYRAIVLSYVGVVLVLGAVVLFALPGSWEFRSLVVGVMGGVLAGGVFWSLRSSGGDLRSKSLPLTAVSLAKRNGRVLVVSGAFDSRVLSGRWTLVADTRDDAEAIASALTAGGG